MEIRSEKRQEEARTGRYSGAYGKQGLKNKKVLETGRHKGLTVRPSSQPLPVIVSPNNAQHQERFVGSWKEERDVRDESHGGCQVNGPKVAKFLDR